MTNVSRAMSSLLGLRPAPGWVVCATVLASFVLATPALAASGKAGKTTKVSAAAEAKPKSKANACGCYQDSAGACLCAKKGRCGCPGQCEPKGCEERRARDMDREIKAETKRAQDSERKHKTASRDKDSSSGGGASEGNRKPPNKRGQNVGGGR